MPFTKEDHNTENEQLNTLISENDDARKAYDEWIRGNDNSLIKCLSGIGYRIEGRKV